MLRHFVLSANLTLEHPDLVQAWLPFHCFLGRSLASGRIPAWNPYAAAGAPFAADPQSGWMSIPVMTLHAAFSCTRALNLLIVLQPILAGLGIYWFLRVERLSRSAACTGGLLLALLLAGSTLGLELPFAGVYAWTALLLAAAAKYVRAPSWPSRLAWLTAVAVCWGQVAMAHFSHGLVVGTGALATYLISAMLRGKHRTNPATILILLVAALPLVNLAALLPRLAYLPRTSLGLGYSEMAARAGHLGRPLPRASPPPGAPFAWPLSLMTAPGAYIGILASAVSFVALTSRRLRRLAVPFLVYGLVAYLLSVGAVARGLSRLLSGLPFVDVYTHAPLRLGHGTRLALVILVACGVQAWVDEPRRARTLIGLVPGVLVWWVLALVSGDFDPGATLFALGLVVTIASLALVRRMPSARVVVPAALALELLAACLLGQQGRVRSPVAGHAAVTPPEVSGAGYLSPPRSTRPLVSLPPRRYATVVRGGLGLAGRKRLAASPDGSFGLANQRSMLFGLESVDVYNPSQLVRYWTLVRAVGSSRLPYNAASFVRYDPVAFDLLDVGWVLARTPSFPGGTLVERDHGWGLFALDNAPHRAQVFDGWESGTTDAAMARIREPGFDPGRDVIVEGLAAQAGTAAPTSAAYRTTGPQSASVSVSAARPSLLVIRNVYDPNWHAAVDGRPVSMFPANVIDQAVQVPGGTHEVLLWYDDPTIGWGLMGSAIALLATLGTALGCWMIRRRAGAPGRSDDTPPASEAG